MTAQPGIDAGRLEPWLESRLPECAPPFELELIAGGHSNLTFSVRDAEGRRWVLRRPPLGHLLPTAHDVLREHRILKALQPTAVPVPEVVAACEDREVIGAPFYVMAMVDGDVLRDRATAAARHDPGLRHQIGLRLADTLASIHTVDAATVDLGDLGKPEGYVARQLRRWKRQLDESRSRPLQQLYEIHDLLAARIPEQRYSGLVHGDFRLDNCIVGPDGGIRAVLDWELCTQGDTLADVGLLMVYWSEPDDPQHATDQPPTLAPGFPSRTEMLDRYSTSRGIDLGSVEFYVAFAYWRLACITEGVYTRYRQGNMGDRAREAEQFEQWVIDLAAAAARSGSAL